MSIAPYVNRKRVYQTYTWLMDARTETIFIENIIMDEISKLCKAANFLLETESSFCFNDRTDKRMDLVVKIGNKDILVDAIIIDANNPSNDLAKGSDVSSSYFPGAAAVIKARSKLRKYKAIIAASKDFQRLETQGR